MKYDKFSILTLATLISIQMNLAYASPNGCPSVEAIKQVPLIYSNGDSTHRHWNAFVGNQKYDTKFNNWTVMMQLRNVKDRNDALKKANTALKTLTFLFGPDRNDTSWGCDYTVADPDVYEVTARCYYEDCWAEK